jgi:hypothetical protein
MNALLVKRPSHEARVRSFVLLAGFFLSGFCAAPWVQGQTAEKKPVKMKVEVPGKNFRAGEPVEIHVTCLDSENNAVQVKQDYTITLLAHLPSGKVDTAKVRIPAGAATQKISLKFSDSGIVHLQAQHDRLMRGETFLRVKAKSKESGAAKPKQNNGAMNGGESFVLAAREHAAPQTAKHTLTLRYSPQRPLLADGKDQATIQAFVLDNDDSTAAEIRVRLFNSGGSLTPQPLVIPPGEDVGSAILTSKDVQNITVEYVSAAPPVALEGEAKMQIPFGPDITQIVLEASQPEIPLVDRADLIVKLRNSEGNPVATDVPRKVSFTITAGRGDIEAKELTIAAGGFEARTSFRPTWRGRVQISAATPNLQIAEVIITVTLPVLALALSALGAALGGVIAYWREQNAQWWRIAIGLVTGFVFYWAFVFGVLPLISREIVLNPLSALALSVIGGWLGTETFNMILKRLGLS